MRLINLFKKFEMLKKIDKEVIGSIFALNKNKCPQNRILQLVNSEEKLVSWKIVYNYIKIFENNKKNFPLVENKQLRKYVRKVLNKVMLAKIKKAAKKRNPPTQILLANKSGVSRRTVRRGLKELNLKLYKKTKVHVLKPHHKKNRRRNCRSLNNLMTKEKLEYMVTLDKSWIHMSSTNGK